MILRENDDIVCLIDRFGQVYGFYKNSDKSYLVNMFCLEPKDPTQEPRKIESESKKPGYVSLIETLDHPESFTPLNQIMLSMADCMERNNNLVTNDDILIEHTDLDPDMFRVVYKEK